MQQTHSIIGSTCQLASTHCDYCVAAHLIPIPSCHLLLLGHLHELLSRPANKAGWGEGVDSSFCARSLV